MDGTDRAAVMNALARLLEAGPGSQIARTARSGLIGLRASLIDAVQGCPDDVALAQGRELIAALGTILAPEDPALARAGQVFPDAAAPQDPALDKLIAGFASDPAVTAWLDASSLADLRDQPDAGGTQAGQPVSGTAAAWRALHLCLLRLPEPLADQWRARAAALAAPAPAGAGGLALRGDAEAILVPARGPAEAGIRVSPQAALDGDVAAVLGLAGGASPGLAERSDRAELAQVASLALGMAALDRQLVLCLESVLFQGSRKLDEKLRRSFRTDLIGRLRGLARCEPGSVAALEALIDVDEAVNSLSHRPPAGLGSWWGQLRQKSRRMTTQAADSLRSGGADVEVLTLGLRYLDVRDLTTGNDVPWGSGGEPGDVLACLRLWARIGTRTIPGRVLYRA
jgi:hypothetical protein